MVGISKVYGTWYIDIWHKVYKAYKVYRHIWSKVYRYMVYKVYGI